MVKFICRFCIAITILALLIGCGNEGHEPHYASPRPSSKINATNTQGNLSVRTHVTQHIQQPQRVICPVCKGSEVYIVICHACNGTGMGRVCLYCGGTGMVVREVLMTAPFLARVPVRDRCPICDGKGYLPCQYCGGRGYLERYTCPYCNGKGIVGQ